MLRAYLLLLLHVSLLTGQGRLPINLQGEIENPPEKFIVDLISLENHMPAGRAFGNTDGRFQFGSVEPGRYELRVTDFAGELLHTEYVDVNANAFTLRIRLRDKPAAKRPISGIVSAGDLRPERRAAMKLLIAGAERRKREDGAGAIQKFEAAIQRDPSFAIAHHELAVEYMRLERPWDARRELLTSIELDPKFVVAYTNLSIADLRMGDPVGAEQAALHALEIDKGNAKALSLLDFARKHFRVVKFN